MTDVQEDARAALSDETHVFHLDARKVLRVWIFIFVFLGGAAIYELVKAAQGQPPDAGKANTLFWVGFFAALLVAPMVGAYVRNDAEFVVGPDGIAFPSRGIPRTPWDNVLEVSTFHRFRRGSRSRYVRVQFVPGTVRQNRWPRWRLSKLDIEVHHNSTYLGEMSRLSAPGMNVVESIGRFIRVKWIN